MFYSELFHHATAVTSTIRQHPIEKEIFNFNSSFLLHAGKQLAATTASSYGVDQPEGSHHPYAVEEEEETWRGPCTSAPPGIR